MKRDPTDFYIGTAGWNIPSQLKNQFPSAGTHLQKYSNLLKAVEINSSFYRDHKFETYVRWAQSTPDNFRFSVKLSRYFTQEKRLTETGARLSDTLQGISGLAGKWGCLLVQLPPSLKLELKVASRFIERLRAVFAGMIVWEPRHSSWSTESAFQLLQANHISRVWADPDPCPVPDGLRSSLEPSSYFRLHGSPEIYRSRYSLEFLDQIFRSMQKSASVHRQVWCIFDNTTFGFATENALELAARFSIAQERELTSKKISLQQPSLVSS